MLTIDANAALVELRGISLRLSNTTPVLAMIGERAALKVRERIQSSKLSPDGDQWAPWAASTQADRERKGNVGQGLLWDEGTLLHSIKVETTANSITVGTDTQYAAYLQDGTGRMPSRQFMGWADEDLHHAEATLLHYLEAGL